MGANNLLAVIDNTARERSQSARESRSVRSGILRDATRSIAPSFITSDLVRTCAK
jgi:hypothetical protein